MISPDLVESMLMAAGKAVNSSIGATRKLDRVNEAGVLGRTNRKLNFPLRNPKSA
jgi:hypothetical protein